MAKCAAVNEVVNRRLMGLERCIRRQYPEGAAIILSMRPDEAWTVLCALMAFAAGLEDGEVLPATRENLHALLGVLRPVMEAAGPGMAAAIAEAEAMLREDAGEGEHG